MIGQIRLQANELQVMEQKPAEKDFEDLRLNQVFPSLLEFAKSIQMAELEDHIYGHVPYVILVIKAMD